ncbi:rhodanese family protein [Sphingomonas sp.]|uniref:rhodanese family protein n=1 Tax=Sphingomonas sp. TaxID=28214 RepID=UPI0025F63C41|nr:rhodanese family protein [Sphingomonas sp.]
MPIKTISPEEARRLINAGASLIDIRSPDEHARERIAGALNIPLDRLAPGTAAGDILVFHCRSGMRTGQAAAQLTEAAGGRDCYIMEGGISAWGNAGLPTKKVRGAPIELQRQVMIVAGSLVLVGTVLSLFLSPLWIALAIFVGVGLTVAGISGFCGMAHLLALMPWNRRPANG